MSLVAWGIALLGWGQVALLLDNLSHFKAPPPARRGGGRVSVLIPARNEAPRIAACVESVMAQTGVELEVWVLDDRSEDDTAARAQAVSPDVRVMAGRTLPPGWAGKCHACDQLASVATGEWLLFLDADTVLEPGAIAAAVALAAERDAALLSLFPRQRMGTPGEQLMLPLLMYLLLGFLPMRLAASRPEPSLAAANGQFLLFSRAGYAAIGGHAGCAGDLVEDMALARAVKRHGLTLVMADGTPWVSCRMYTGFADLWAGFRKNVYPAFGGRPGPFVFGLGLLVALGVLPVVLLAWGLAVGDANVWGPALLALTAAFTGRFLLARRLEQPGWSVWAHPVAIALLSALALDSWRGWAGGGVVWKGRTYAGKVERLES